MKKRLALLLASAMLIGALGGCGSSSTTADSSSEGSTETVTTTDTTAESSEVSGDDKYGGSVTLTLATKPATYFLPFSVSTADRKAAYPAIETLGRMDEEGNINGWLAESFEVDSEALTATIVLKEGINFSDGTPLNAEAVIWNFDKMNEGGKIGELGTPISYEAVDDKTVKLTYDKWGNDWEALLGDVCIYCPAAFEENGADWASINPVGTGPYVVKEYVKDSHITYARNENYWIEGQPYLDEISINWLTDPTAQISAFSNGEIQLLETSNKTVADALKGSNENHAEQSPNTGSIKYAMFASAVEDSPFYNENVRLAVMHSIDWEGYANALTFGDGIAVNQFGVPGAWSYDESVGFVEFDTELAKQMLAEAGYPDGFSTVITTQEEYNDSAVLLQDSLLKIGITAEIKVLSNADFSAQKKEGTYDGGIIVGQGASKMDFTNNYIRLYSSEGTSYQAMMTHPEDYEEALFGARAAKTIEEKKELLKVASVKLVQEHALIFPMGVIFPYIYQDVKLQDTGVGSNQDSWTPEAMYLEK
ncbi:MAG: ABC transporter substrate-binding protein [Lachnospiraceae bacterium]